MTKKKRSKVEDSDEEEEDEISEEEMEIDEEAARPSKGRGVASAAGRRRKVAREEEDDVEEDEEDEFNDGYDNELMSLTDPEDRTRLMAMTEFEREVILTDRADRRERDRLLHQQRIKERTAARAAARGGPARAPRSSGRQTGTGDAKAKGALQALAAAQKMRGRRKTAGPDEGDEGDAAGGMEEEEEEEGGMEEVADGDAGGGDDAAPEPPEEVELARQDQLRQVWASRDKMEKWANLPLFAVAVQGAFVRVAIGTRPVADQIGPDGRPVMRQVYKLASVHRVLDFDAEDSRGAYARERPQLDKAEDHLAKHYPRYRLTAVPGSPWTRTYLELALGASKKIFALTYLSNTPFDDAEYRSWGAKMSDDLLTPPTVPEVSAVKAQLKALATTSLSAADIQAMLARKREAGLIAGGRVAVRQRLLGELSHAQERLAIAEGVAAAARAAAAAVDESDDFGAEEQAAREAEETAEMARREVATLEGQLEKAGQAPDTTHVEPRRDLLATINKRNIGANFQLIMERGAGEGAAPGAAKVELDPFSRRPTRPHIMWNHRSQAPPAEATVTDTVASPMPPAAPDTAAVVADAAEESLEATPGPGGVPDLATVLARAHDITTTVDLSRSVAAAAALQAMQQPGAFDPSAHPADAVAAATAALARCGQVSGLWQASNVAAAAAHLARAGPGSAKPPGTHEVLTIGEWARRCAL